MYTEPHLWIIPVDSHSLPHNNVKFVCQVNLKTAWRLFNMLKLKGMYSSWFNNYQNFLYPDEVQVLLCLNFTKTSIWPASRVFHVCVTTENILREKVELVQRFLLIDKLLLLFMCLESHLFVLLNFVYVHINLDFEGRWVIYQN